MSDVRMNPPTKLNRSGINRIIQVLGFVLIIVAILFGLAGRLDWWEAWIFLAIYLLGILANGLWSLRHGADVINERGRIPENTKSWDKVIAVIYTVLLLGTIVLSALDARFAWSSEPLWVKVLGGIGISLSETLVFWVMATNPFLSGVVRIQDDRGHYTVTTGPYRYVRHPMYVGMLFLFWGIPLLLGSWWALVPAVLNMILYVIRTALEDRTLQAELPGYVEYTRKVRYRLVPGIW